MGKPFDVLAEGLLSPRLTTVGRTSLFIPDQRRSVFSVSGPEGAEFKTEEIWLPDQIVGILEGRSHAVRKRRQVGKEERVGEPPRRSIGELSLRILVIAACGRATPVGPAAEPDDTTGAACQVMNSRDA